MTLLYSQQEPADGPNRRLQTDVPLYEPHSPLAPQMCQGVNSIEAITVESLLQSWSASMPNRLQGMHWAMCARTCFAQNGLSSSLTGVGVGVGKGALVEDDGVWVVDAAGVGSGGADPQGSGHSPRPWLHKCRWMSSKEDSGDRPGYHCGNELMPS